MEFNQLIQSIVVGLITGAFSGGAAWAVIKTEIKYLRRDVDNAHARLNNCDAHKRGC